MVVVSALEDRTSRAPRSERVADRIVRLLVDAGVDVVFGVPGGAISPVYDALLDEPRVRVVTTRHEAGAMFAAAGYARTSGRPGVVLVTSGPGVINTMTGLATAYCDGLPVLVLSGEVPRRLHGRLALQEGTAHHLNVIGMAKPITKLALEVTEARTAAAVVRRALSTMTSGRRGPALLTLPLDVIGADHQPMDVVGQARVSFQDESGERERAIERTAERLRRARRPMIYAGSGARWGDGPARLVALAERLQCPVATTPKAKGVFPERHPLSLGVFGHGGHPSSSTYLEEGVDVLLTVGAGMSDPATDGWSPLLIPTDELIAIDVDALQLGRNYPVTRGIVGDAADVLERLCAALPHGPCPTRRFQRFTTTHPAVAEVGAAISPQRALWELQRVMPADTIFTCDIGEHLLFATHYLTVDEPDGWIALTGLASMGASVGTALGARMALPDRRVAAICGDGGFAMMCGEIATACQYGVPLVVVVLNDRRYGMVELGHEAIFGRAPLFPTGALDVSAAAAAAGARVVEVRRPDELLAQPIADDSVVVINVLIDPTAKMPKSQRFSALKKAALE